MSIIVVDEFFYKLFFFSIQKLSVYITKNLQNVEKEIIPPENISSNQ